MRKIILSSILAAIGVGILSFLIIQNVTHQEYLDIEISGLKAEYNIGEDVAGDVILEGYGTGCGTLKIALENQGMDGNFDCVEYPQSSQIRVEVPFVFTSKDLQSGSHVIKVSFNQESIEKTIIITNSSDPKSGTFYAQPQLTSVILKRDDTIRVHLFSYAITAYSDNKWVQVFDERPKNSKIGIVERSTDYAKTFVDSGREILPNGITAKKLFEEGYFVVYLTADLYTRVGKYELSVVSIDENGAVIEKPLHVTIVEQPSTTSSQEKILRVVGSGHNFGLYLDNISEQEYWKIQESRKPWPPAPILNITDSNIHPAVKKLIDTMWDPSGKHSPYEYDKNILVKDAQVILSGSDHKAITDWLKKIHDQQFERNLDDSSSDYIRYQDKIYTFGGWIA
jgi:hypothetical protein